jgi:diguanylate cyclase (GGDEF)-like protein
MLTRLSHLLTTASEAHPVSLIMADIDLFKAINDQLGHAVGDQILQQLAALMSRCCQATELVSRYGGEELAVLIRAGEAPAVKMANDLRELVERHQFVEGVKVTISLGVSTADEPVEPEILLREADEALYAAKAGGRNLVRSHRTMERAAIERGEDLALTSFENLTRVVSDRIATTISRRGRQLFEQLKHQADVDALTQLYSRRYLDRRLVHDFSSAQSESRPLTVALMDLDHFGQVNKRHGWPSGDRVLIEIAELIRSRVRATDWVGRYGGEEICLVMPDTSMDQASFVLERLRQAVAGHTFESTTGQPIRLTVSIGASEVKSDDGDTAELVERVSARLLAAKRKGRNRLCV